MYEPDNDAYDAAIQWTINEIIEALTDNPSLSDSQWVSIYEEMSGNDAIEAYENYIKECKV
tara:strand:- start:87 stop:269 length:183 start_codon:yes stop_codon:yes gene_type:complete